MVNRWAWLNEDFLNCPPWRGRADRASLGTTTTIAAICAFFAILFYYHYNTLAPQVLCSEKTLYLYWNFGATWRDHVPLTLVDPESPPYAGQVFEICTLIVRARSAAAPLKRHAADTPLHIQ